MSEQGTSIRDRWAASWDPARIASSSTAPIWMGVSIALGYLAIHWAFDAVYLVTVGFPPGVEPAWRSDLWWPDLVNAVLTGYLPAAQALAQRGVARDLAALRHALRCSDAEFAAIRRDAASGGPVGRTLPLFGFLIGIVIVFTDPSLSQGATHSLSDPRFVWALPRTAIFAWLVARLVVSDFNTTRIYTDLGRNRVEIDLLNLNELALFARRGLRSALTWVLFSCLFSLFWFGGNAAQANLPLLVLTLTMASAAFALPVTAVRNNVLTVKRAELERLGEEIRGERERAFAPPSRQSNPSPRLANLIAYYRLIESAREWPTDAANLLRFLLYMLLGLGSWLGGAVVERALDNALRSVG